MKLPDGSLSPIKNPVFDKYEVFAGKGSDKELRVRDFLVENYGGKSEEWFHAKVILMLPMKAEQPEKQMYIGLKKKQ